MRTGFYVCFFIADSLADIRLALMRERDARVADGRRVLRLTAAAQDQLVAQSVQSSTLSKYQRDYEQVCSELGEPRLAVEHRALPSAHCCGTTGEQVTQVVRTERDLGW